MTRDGGGKPTRGGRQLTDEEAELWRHLGLSVDKVKKKQRVTDRDDGLGGSHAEPATPARRHSESAPASRSVRAAAPPRVAVTPSRAPAPSELDRRAQRQVAAGKVAIDGVLDLHGLRQDAAHGRLRAFLMSSQANGLRMVLIVTGKGTERGVEKSGTAPDDWSSGAAQRGVLRRSVPLWLEEPPLRDIVLSYASAGVRHGGEGALYVRLRKPRKP
jgi:DNA-nicking Smr family endonuclease